MATGRSALGAEKSLSGFYAPAEESRHAGTWMCWPSTQAIYGETAYFEAVQEALGRLAAAIAENEPVTLLAAADQHALAARLCGPKVKLLDVATDDMWARDSGPVFLRHDDGRKAALDFNFNGWGNKERHAKDSRVAAAIATARGCRHVRSALVGEGGGLEYDGEGTLILTDSCWVNDNRNPGKTQAEIEAELKAGLGVGTVIWLPGVRGQEITDGHIDGTLRFIRPGVVLMSGYPGDTSEWGRVYAESKKIMQKARDARGRGFEIAETPYATVVRSRRSDFFSGYANYYVGNGAVYTPQFGDAKADAGAQEPLARLYPDRKVVALEVDRIYENGGGIHCVTQQEPA